MKTVITLISFALCCLLSDICKAQWNTAGSVGSPGIAPRISVVDSNIVWISGGSGTVPKLWRTLDGGSNWTVINTTGLPYWLYTVSAKDALTAFVADAGNSGFTGGNAHLFKTTNGGMNWILVDSTGGTQAWISTTIFSKLNPNFGFVVSDPPDGPGAPFYFTKTTDGGQTWTRSDLPGVPNTLTLGDGAFCIDPLFYGFLIINSSYSDSTRVYMTSNGGLNWFIRYPGVSLGSTFGGWCDFNDTKDIGIFINAGMLPNMAKTTNGGVNWNIINSGISGTGHSVIRWISGSNTVFVTANSSPPGHVFRSDDNGLTWTTQNTSSVQFIEDASYVRFGSLVYGYAINAVGTVIKTRQGVVPVGIRPISNQVPSQFSLSQNYPNPFNPTTNIRFDIPKSGNISLKVYNELGKEVSTLINTYKHAGSYEINFDATNLSSGIYFYKLVVSGANPLESEGYGATKKMLLIK